MKIDSWDDAYGYLIVDSQIIDISIYNSTYGTSSICGLTTNDYSFPLDANFTHTSDSMTINITTTLNSTVYQKSFGIKKLFLLVDYVNFT